MRNFKRASIHIFVGIILITIGIFAFIQQILFMTRVFNILGKIFLVQSVFNLYQYFIHKKEKLDLPVIFLTMFVGIFILLYTNIPVFLFVIIFAIYITMHGIVHLYTYLHRRKNKISGRLIALLSAIVLLVNGVVVLLSPSVSGDQVIQIIAIYSILLGIRYINDAVLMFVPEKQKDDLKRKFRINLPIFVTAIFPKLMMDYVNDMVAVKLPMEVKNTDKEINLEIYIHASGQGYGQVGHCDIYIDGEIISYGNYDYYSTKFFEILGDGVLIISKKDEYLPFCIKEDKKTIFGYGLHLNEVQLEAVRQAIAALKADSYQWYPPAYFDGSNTADYASRLYLETGASYYKFKKGKFKNYFLFGNNCVLLVEHLIGRIGHDIINMNGIISPGRYQEYLQKEYYKKDSQVVTRNVYNKESINHH